MIAEPIRARLLFLGSVTGLLATYEFTSGSPTPAIFTTAELPKNASLPAIRINEIGGVHIGSFGNRGAETQVDVDILFDKKFDAVARRTLAQAVWEGLNRAPLTIPGYEESGVYADPPHEMLDTEGFPTIQVRVMVRTIEED